jgi:hypothetical protein
LRWRNLSPPPALLGLQVAFANVFAEALEHGGPAPRMLNALLIRPTKILTSKMSIKKERPSKKHFVVTNRGEECRLAEAWNSNRFLTVRRGTRARTPLSAICPCPNPPPLPVLLREHLHFSF